jgi:hypothetical protein
MFSFVLLGGIDPYRLMIIVGILVLIWSFSNGGLDGLVNMVKEIVEKIKSAVPKSKPKDDDDIVVVLNDDDEVKVPEKTVVVKKSVKNKPDVVEVVREWRELREVAEDAQLSDAVSKLDELFATLNKPVEVKKTPVAPVSEEV